MGIKIALLSAQLRWLLITPCINPPKMSRSRLCILNMYVYAYSYIYICIHMLSIYSYICACMCMCIYIYTHIHIDTCVHIRKYICVCIYIYTYIYIDRERSRFPVKHRPCEKPSSTSKGPSSRRAGNSGAETNLQGL